MTALRRLLILRRVRAAAARRLGALAVPPKGRP